MTHPLATFRWSHFALLAMLIMASGCHRRKAGMYYNAPPPAQMLGQGVDEIYQMQEENAEASKYVIYQHEFKLNQSIDGKSVGGIRLNEYGEDHLKQIAENLREGSPYPVVVERSQTSIRPGTKHEYPVHFNSKLDMQRREVIVQSLVAMGISDADESVVVAPAFAQGLTGAEAESAYRTGLGNRGRAGSGLGGFGGFGGGFGGGLGGGF